MIRRLALVLLLASGCTEAVAPRPAGQEYALESVRGDRLPAVLATDYDVTVSVVSDVITLRTDSTFLEVAEFRGVSSDDTLVAVDSLAGTYSISGSTLYLLTPGAQATRLTIDGETLRQDFGSGMLVYRLVK